MQLTINRRRRRISSSSVVGPNPGGVGGVGGGSTCSLDQACPQSLGYQLNAFHVEPGCAHRREHTDVQGMTVQDPVKVALEEAVDEQ